MNKIDFNLSLLNNINVEPIALKLAHVKNEAKTDAMDNGERNQTYHMWWIIMSGVFMLLVLFLVSYFVVNSYYGDIFRSEYFAEDDAYEENNREL
ncbi:Maph95 [Matsumuraeses phaseoli granulovirus]|uniref:Maph95 n=1 Tax=Matsumuraeses phaseoli granulovirus TaxID=2760664 RepID=A0AAE7SXR6_9BBAC|nr:Maph95 [Matsumuraeses phaseoli granulovirus]QOD40058.1 Maph95 [Matsumuraeses phaseoli granulovirus]